MNGKYFARLIWWKQYISNYKPDSMYKSTYLPIKHFLYFGFFVLSAFSARANCPVTDSTITASICSGDTFYVGTFAHTQTNIYSDTLVNFMGCDSIVTLNLTVIAPIHTTVGDTICTGDTVYFNGHGYTTSGTHKDTLTAVTGCDSIVTMNIFVRPILHSATNQSICRGGSFNFYGVTITQPGTYKDTLTTPTGCDSVITLTLSYSADVPHYVNATICAGNTYVFNGDTLIYSGTYNDTLVSSGGCDSLVILTLDILPNPLEPYIVPSGDTLTASYAPAYQWLLDGNPLAGDTSAAIIAGHTGNYQVEITGPNGCKNTSAGYYEIMAGVNSTGSIGNVNLYPNPNNGSFVIAFSDNALHAVQITDARGRVVMTEENVTGTKTFNLSELAGGVYFTRIKRHDEIKTTRFVIAR
jgi:Secretion system C-terminal sorting domain